MREKKPFHFTIQMKLMLSYFVLISLLLLLFASFSYIRVSDISRTQVQYSAKQAFDQAVTFFEYKVSNLIRISEVVYFDENVQQILKQSREIYADDIYAQTADIMYLNSFLSNLKNKTDVYRAAIYFPDWFPYADQGINFLNIDDLRSTSDYERLINSKDLVYWTGVQEIPNDYFNYDPARVISLLRKIRNSNDLTEVLGVIRLSVLESTIAEILSNAKTSPNNLVFLLNSHGEIVCSSNPEKAETLSQNEILGRLPQDTQLDWDRIEIDHKEDFVKTKGIENTDWKIISIIPNEDILAQSRNIRNLIIQIGLWIAGFSCVIAFLFSNSFVRRIRLLAESMRRVQKGELGINLASKGQDEIDEVMDTFNYMLQRIRLLLDKQYQSGVNLKNAELKALQSQINPHFLYNTLELIGWKALDHKAPDIHILVTELARFYKLSLSQGQDFVSIADEIKHIQTYVNIQNMRFENSVRLVIDIDETLYTQSIVKITLQPLVENAIQHGFRKHDGQTPGIITVTGRLETPAVILLTLQDNGSGMCTKQLASLLKAPKQDTEHGYGVYNIDQRLKICYGGSFGLKYSLPPEGGVKVEIRIPYRIYPDTG